MASSPNYFFWEKCNNFGNIVHAETRICCIVSVFRFSMIREPEKGYAPFCYENLADLGINIPSELGDRTLNWKTEKFSWYTVLLYQIAF